MSALYFPQLTNGSLAQYPVARRWSKAVTTNTLPDGSTVIMTGPAPPRVSWELRYTGLSVTEWGALETLFEVSQGRFGTFRFVDPTDNLLVWSEDLTAPAWSADPLLQVSTAVGDPMGGSSAAGLTNDGQAPQRLMQTVAGPSWFQYCFSVYLRSDAPVTVDLIRAGAGDEVRQTVSVVGTWARFHASGVLGSQDDGISFGIELAAGTSAFVFGAQVEAQPCAGAYKTKLDRSGVYPKSRFDQDTLVHTTDTSGQYSTTIRITASY